MTAISPEMAHHMHLRQYSASWDQNFHKPGTQVLGVEFFSEATGYSVEDLAGIRSLRVGDTWKSPHDGDSHTVTRLPDQGPDLVKDGAPRWPVPGAMVDCGRSLRVNVRQVVDELDDPSDEGLAGIWAVNFDFDDTGMSNGQRAGAAKDIFHGRQGIENLDDFQIDVVDWRGRPVAQDDDYEEGAYTDSGSVEKISDEPLDLRDRHFLVLTPRDERTLAFIAGQYEYAAFLQERLVPEEDQSDETGVRHQYSLSVEDIEKLSWLAEHGDDGRFPMLAGDLRRTVESLVEQALGEKTKPAVLQTAPGAALSSLVGVLLRANTAGAVDAVLHIEGITDAFDQAMEEAAKALGRAGLADVARRYELDPVVVQKLIPTQDDVAPSPGM
ncbi:hypothetical protein [Ralstonia sp. ASV6]|uniref:hypothetical protein n=1 Tax=Ralstonia sp. ASV6 TaxID=2795124 RepID=UPI0018EDB73C|nr:hypothetical protein [Ralstonia sp. ASV6]